MEGSPVELALAFSPIEINITALDCLSGLKRLELKRYGQALNKEKIAIVVNSASYDRVAYALTIALTSTALGKEAYVLFTYGALRRLVKGETDRVEGETDAWIREAVKVGIVAGSIRKISEMLKDLKKSDGKVYACVSAMAFHDVTKDELIEEVDRVTGITAFLEMTKGASMVLYV